MASHTSPDYEHMEGSRASLGYGINDTSNIGGESGGEVVNSGRTVAAHVNEERAGVYMGPSVEAQGRPLRDKATANTIIGWEYWGLAFLLTFTPLIPIAIYMYVMGIYKLVTGTAQWVGSIAKDKT